MLVRFLSAVRTSGHGPSPQQRVLGASFLVAALSAPGQTFFVSLYVPDISLALGMSPVALSLVYGGATLVGAGLLPIIGIWADRWPADRFLSVVVFGLGLSLLALAGAHGPMMLAVAWTLSRCLGQGAVGVGMLAALSRTFHVQRGRALAIGTLGHPFGEFVFPALVAVLLALTTWRQSLLLLGSVYLVLFTPAVAAWLRSAPHGETATMVAPGPHEPSSGVGEALRTPVFWTATVVLTAAPIVVTALLFHQAAFFEHAGLARTQVPIALMYFAAAQVLATVSTGGMVDRGSLRMPLALSCLALIGSPLWLVVPIPEAVRVGLYGLSLGYATGAAGVAGAALWPVYFGLAAVGRIRAVTSGIRNAATALAPVALALVIQWGDLRAAQIVLVALGSSALLVTAFLPRVHQLRRSLTSSGEAAPVNTRPPSASTDAMSRRRGFSDPRQRVIGGAARRPTAPVGEQG